jgi:hypothetical protein
MLIPGKRFAGVDHLKKMAKILKEKYGISSQVLANGTGPVYQHHLVSKYDSMAQIQEVQEKLFGDEEYLAWFKESEDLVQWKNATQNVYQVFD